MFDVSIGRKEISERKWRMDEDLIFFFFAKMKGKWTIQVKWGWWSLKLKFYSQIGLNLFHANSPGVSILILNMEEPLLFKAFLSFPYKIIPQLKTGYSSLLHFVQNLTKSFLSRGGEGGIGREREVYFLLSYIFFFNFKMSRSLIEDYVYNSLRYIILHLHFIYIMILCCSYYIHFRLSNEIKSLAIV